VQTLMKRFRSKEGYEAFGEAISTGGSSVLRVRIMTTSW
jgi:hypothetical protein